MISAAAWWTVIYTVTGIALAAATAGFAALRLLAARPVATSMTVVAAVSATATAAGVIVIATEMFISQEDLDVVLAVVSIAAIAGVAVAIDHGRFFGSGHGAFSRPVQLLAAAAFLAVAATLVDRPAKAHA